MANILITGISSDIGKFIAREYVNKGHRVIGTYNNKANINDITDLDVELFECDFSKINSINELVKKLIIGKLTWDRLISCIGLLDPIGPFFSQNIDDWRSSHDLNSISQLVFLHKIFGSRRRDKTVEVIFLVGGALNRSSPNYTAYSLGKSQLVKFCELIHEEEPNIHALTVGTGWVATKIHLQTLRAGKSAGLNYQKTLDFVNDPKSGTPLEDILKFIEWCFSQPRSVTGGRNFSIVNDPWREKNSDLISNLLVDPNLYKFRRFGADF